MLVCGSLFMICLSPPQKTVVLNSNLAVKQILCALMTIIYQYHKYTMIDLDCMYAKSIHSFSSIIILLLN